MFELAQSSGLWEYVGKTGSLGVVRRRAEPRPTYTGAGSDAAARVEVDAMRLLGAVPPRRDRFWTVLGQDGGQSIDLGEERTLFLFSDTLLAVPLDASLNGHPTVAFGPLDKQGVALANTAAIAGGRDIRQAFAGLEYLTDATGLPVEILQARPDEWADGVRFWPLHGIQLDGKVYVFYLGIRTLDSRSSWAFKNIGVGLAVLEPGATRATRLMRDDQWCWWPAGADDVHIGVQVLRDADYAYVFASHTQGMEITARLGRVHLDRVDQPDAYEFLRSSAAEDEWTPRFEDSISLGPCAPDYSVSYNAHLRQYLMLYIDGFDKTLRVRTAERVTGPYSAARKIANVPHEPSSELVYLGFEHPMFSAQDGRVLYFSYCQPRFTPMRLARLTLR
jgi:hypothetical protein